MSAKVDDLLLGHLRWSWDSAYEIKLTKGSWSAKRRDNGRTLVARDADELSELIIADYTARPVPRPEPSRRMPPGSH